MTSVADPRNSAEIGRALEQAFSKLFPGPPSILRPLPQGGANNDGDLSAPCPVVSVIAQDDKRRDWPNALPAERIERIGTVSARVVTEASETAAADIEQAGQSAVDIAADLMREAQGLAKGLRANGKRISERLQRFAMLANKVSTAMRRTHAEGVNDVVTTRLPEQEQTCPEPDVDAPTDPAKVFEAPAQNGAPVPT
jgi:hypothetical protein